MTPRVLLVRFTAIGDCVMAAWAATALREKHPDAFLCWAVESRCAPMLDRTALVSRVEEIPRDRWKRTRWSPATWREQLTKYAGLRRLRFDVGIDLQGYSKTALCLRLASPRKRVSAYAKDAFAARLNPVVGIRPSDMHTVEWYGRVLQTLGDYQIPDRPIMPRDPDAAQGIIERVGGDQPLATITVSAGHSNKAYYADGWVEVAQGLMARGYRVAFLGGPTDRGIEVPGSVDLVGKLALSSTLEAVRLSALHVSADTGNAHMAAAVGVPTVSVFGPTDPVAFRPFHKEGRVLRNGVDPASVTPAEILAAVHDLVGR
jgi:ADP-heptose:LPS heptosyltransferase